MRSLPRAMQKKLCTVLRTIDSNDYKRRQAALILR